MTSTDLAVVLGRFSTVPDGYVAARAHPRFGAELALLEERAAVSWPKLARLAAETGVPLPLLSVVDHPVWWEVLEGPAWRQFREDVLGVIAAFVLATTEREPGPERPGPQPRFFDRDILASAARMCANGDSPRKIADGTALTRDNATALRLLMVGGLIKWTSRGLWVDPIRVRTEAGTFALRWRESADGDWQNPIGRDANPPPPARSR